VVSCLDHLSALDVGVSFVSNACLVVLWVVEGGG
jgi:hypothetical protein